MQFTLFAAALFAGLAAASPAERRANEARNGGAYLKFWAAANNIHEQYFAIDGQEYPVYSDLSFTSISSHIPPNAYCLAFGIDHSVTYLSGDATDVPIGPPQVQKTVKCQYYY